MWTQVRGSAAKAAPGVHFLAQQIDHHRIAVARRVAERPAGDGADMLLELADGAGIERPVAGIVHPRRDLVDDQLRALDEQFDRQHADIVEAGGDAPGDLPGLGVEQRS
jgi:hypothetical protein